MKSLTDRNEIDKPKINFEKSNYFSPKNFGVIPKYFHNFSMKKVHAKKSFNIIFNSVSIEKENKRNFSLSSLAKSNNNELKTIRIKTQFSESHRNNNGISYGSTLKSIIHSQNKLRKEEKKIKNEELLEFYIEILRKVELLNFKRVYKEKKSNKLLNIKN